MTNEEFIKSVSLEGEVWKDVVGYEDCYMVSNKGRILSKYRLVKHPKGSLKSVKPRLMCLKKNKAGYMSVTLYVNHTSKTFTVHRLVAIAFIQNPHKKPQIDHIDRDRANNIVENLKWCTASENMMNPLTRPIVKLINKGRKRPYAHHPVVAIKNDVIVYRFDKLMDCEKFGFNYTIVSTICAGRRKTHKGFKFMYLSDYENLTNKSKNN